MGSTLSRSAIPTGVKELDSILGGGFRLGELYFVYGEEASGKTSLALTITASAIKQGLKQLFVDCSGRLHPLRISQVAEKWSIELSDILVKPIRDFGEQEDLVIKLYNLKKLFNVVVLDDFTYQYRLELSGDLRRDLILFKRFAFQVAVLSELAEKYESLVLIVGQVHDIPEHGVQKPVAYRILYHWAKWILKLSSHDKVDKILFIEKPPTTLSARFMVSDRGVDECRVR